MIAVILIALLVISAVFLVANLVMMRRENRQLQEDLCRSAPLRDPRFATPYVPGQWQPAESDPKEPDQRDTPPPSDPAS